MSNDSRRGKFIVFEGLDFVGKTTAATAYAQHLNEAGHPCLYTREPGGTARVWDDRDPVPASPMAEEIREVVLKNRDEYVGSMTELLLMYAAREQHVNEVIDPTLDAGHHVICDRFTLSTYIYQVFGNRPDLGDLNAELMERVVGKCRPDLTVLLTAPFSEVEKRASSRYERNRLDVLNARRHYTYQNEMVKRLPTPGLTLDTTEWQDPGQEIITALDTYFTQHAGGTA